MREIINCINEAEQKAAEVKAKANERAAAIAEQAEERAADILKLSEAECKAFREKALKQAEADAQKNYENEITVKRAEASKYCAARLKVTDKTVNDIVRRITRGGC